MPERPEVLLSAAVSLDGYLDDTSPTRLILSSPDDLAAVKRLRGDYDAIMVGATTIRRDNPSLRAIDRPNPRKITITGTGNLDPEAQFFTTGEPPIVFCRDSAVDQLRPALLDRADIIPLHTGAGLHYVLATLWRLGIRNLMVEGGGTLHTQFLTQGLADELRLAVAPFFVGDNNAPRFTNQGTFPHDKNNRMKPQSVDHLGDTAVLHYKLGKLAAQTK